MERLLITGGGGFLGGHLASIASACWDVFTTHCSSAPPENNRYTPIHLDIRDRDEVARVFSDITPKAIIHTAALSSVGDCFLKKDLAWHVNVDGTEHIVQAANRMGARLIHMSTDLVFDGKAGGYSEKDLPNPLSYYGKTKLSGEKVVSLQSLNYATTRTSLIYGWGLNTARSFAEAMVRDLCEDNPYTAFIDEYRNPIYVRNLCEILLEMASREGLQGIYHVCSSGRLSRYDFARQLCNALGLKKSLILPVSSDDYDFGEKRPKDCSMLNHRAKRDLHTPFTSVEEGLAHMRQLGIPEW